MAGANRLSCFGARYKGICENGLTIRRDEIEGAPDIGVTWRSDYIAGVVRRNGSFVVIVDLARLFSDSGDALGGFGRRVPEVA